MARTILEVCVDDVAGARAAERGGADRIELCAALSEGGLTPSHGLIEAIVSDVDLPVVVLIRPRGGDFVYSPEEFRVMERDITVVRNLGATGIAIGALRGNATIDEELMIRFRQSAGPLEITFHRAFDFTPDAHAALDTLVDLGVSRVLTSGQAPTAPDGLASIRDLVTRAAGRIVVMPAGGVRIEHVARVVEETGATGVHFSARSTTGSPMSFPEEDIPLASSSPPRIDERRVTDADLVARYRSAVDALAPRGG